MAHLFALLMLAFSQVVIGANEPSPPAVKQDESAKVKLELTVDEQQWLSEHKNIRIAYDGSLPPYSFVNDEGKIDGVALEIITVLSQRLGINFTVYPDYNWTSLYKAAAKRKADVVATMVSRPDRTVWFGFTKPYLTKSLVIVTKSDNSAINNRDDISNKTVAVVKGYQYADQLIKEFPSVKLVKVETMLDGLKSVISGQADAAIIFLGTVNYLQAKHSLNNLRIAAFYDRNNANESIAVRKDWPILLALLQKGLDSLHEEEVQKIFAKWVIGGTPVSEMPPQEIKPIAPVTAQVEPPAKKVPEQPSPAKSKPGPPPSVDFTGFTTPILAVSLGVVTFLFLLWKILMRKQKRVSLTAKNEMMTSVRNLQSEQNEGMHLTIEPSFGDISAKGSNKPSDLNQESNPDAISFHRDCDGRLTYVSTNVTSLLGYSEAYFMENFLNCLTDNPVNLLIDDHLDLIIQGQPAQPYKIELYDAGRNIHWLEITDTPVYNGLGHLTGLDGVMTDVTAQQLYEKITVKSGQPESSSNIPDQLQILYTHLKNTIHQASQNHQNFILIYTMLDRFRSMDGETVESDEIAVLNEATRRLKATLRDTDEVIQFQSNKFALLLPDTNSDMISLMIEKIRKILQVPYLIGVHSIVLNANIGIAVYPKNGNDPVDLITEAQILLPQDDFEADNSSASSGDKPSPTNTLELQQDLLAALDECKLSLRASNQQNLNVLNRHSQLSAYYQSLHNLSDYSIAGFEALIRWRHPQLGLLTPIDFVDLIKDIGMTDVMTYWIIQQVSFQSVFWENQDTRPDFIIVNLSGLTAHRPIDIDKVKLILSEAGADPSWLLFSFPESEVVSNTGLMIPLLKKFTDAGLRIAIDNFGPDNNFISQLPVISAQIIEIDPYFTYDVSDNFSNDEIINHTVAMLQAQGKKVVVKGIETEAQLDFLKKTGCDMVQGHLLSRALPSTEAKELMETFPDVAWYFQQK